MVMKSINEVSENGGDNYFAEFFAGIGLVHAGLKEGGWTCVYANDIDPKKHEMYQHRFGNVGYYHVADIWKTDEVLERITQPLKLVTASFPCVDLSVAGKGRGLQGQSSGTFFGFLEVLRGLAQREEIPAAILVENVMGFLSANQGRDFRAVCSALAKLGYWLDVIVVDAKYFTPQSRPRVFIIGFQEGALPPEAKLGAGPEQAIRPKKLVQAMQTLDVETELFHLENLALPNEKQAIADVLRRHDGRWWESDRVAKHLNEMSEAHRELLQAYAKGKTLEFGTMYRRVRAGKSRTEIRFDGLAGCLRTPRGGSSKQMVVVAGQGKIKMRWMTPKEYATLQGMPDFPIRVSTTQALFGFGDAVCVPVIAWIAKNYLST